MNYRVLIDFRNGEDKYKKNELLVLESKEKAKKLIEDKLIEVYEDKGLLLNENKIIESLKAEIRGGKARVKEQQEKIEELQSKLSNLSADNVDDSMKDLMEYILQKENLEKMEISLIDGMASVLEIEIEGNTKKEKATSLFDMVTK